MPEQQAQPAHNNEASTDMEPEEKRDMAEASLSNTIAKSSDAQAQEDAQLLQSPAETAAVREPSSECLTASSLFPVNTGVATEKEASSTQGDLRTASSSPVLDLLVSTDDVSDREKHTTKPDTGKDDAAQQSLEAAISLVAKQLEPAPRANDTIQKAPTGSDQDSLAAPKVSEATGYLVGDADDLTVELGDTSDYSGMMPMAPHMF